MVFIALSLKPVPMNIGIAILSSAYLWTLIKNAFFLTNSTSLKEYLSFKKLVSGWLYDLSINS